MDKKLFAFICVIALVIGASVFLSRYFNPENFKLYGNWQIQPTMAVSRAENSSQSAAEIKTIAGICALLLIGQLFWIFIRKFKKDNQADLISSEDSLYKISLATGWTEYDLFYKSAEDWSISDDRLKADFKRYMTDQVLPYYAMDLVRKNHEHIDEFLIKKEEIEPTSWWDLAKALLIFPGCFFLPFLILIIFNIKASY